VPRVPPTRGSAEKAHAICKAARLVFRRTIRDIRFPEDFCVPVADRASLVFDGHPKKNLIPRQTPEADQPRGGERLVRHVDAGTNRRLKRHVCRKIIDGAGDPHLPRSNDEGITHTDPELSQNCRVDEGLIAGQMLSPCARRLCRDRTVERVTRVDPTHLQESHGPGGRCQDHRGRGRYPRHLDSRTAKRVEDGRYSILRWGIRRKADIRAHENVGLLLDGSREVVPKRVDRNERTHAQSDRRHVDADPTHAVAALSHREPEGENGPDRGPLPLPSLTSRLLFRHPTPLPERSSATRPPPRVRTRSARSARARS